VQHLSRHVEILQRQDYIAGEKSIVRVYKIPELDHAWSGGDGTAPFHSGEGPEASELMWEFLEQHRRRTDCDQSQDGERLDLTIPQSLLEQADQVTIERGPSI